MTLTLVDQMLNDLFYRPAFGSFKVPYNLVKVGENYVYEFSLSGFTEDEVSVEQVENDLLVKAKKEHGKEGEYVYRGLSSRDFACRVPLGNFRVESASLKNGVLEICLEPEEKAVKKISLS